jgi:hypothetical protein
MSAAFTALGLLVLRGVWQSQHWWTRVLPTLCVAISLFELLGVIFTVGIDTSLRFVFARLYNLVGWVALALLGLSLLVGLIASVLQRRGDMPANPCGRPNRTSV